MIENPIEKYDIKKQSDAQRHKVLYFDTELCPPPYLGHSMEKPQWTGKKVHDADNGSEVARESPAAQFTRDSRESGFEKRGDY